MAMLKVHHLTGRDPKFGTVEVDIDRFRAHMAAQSRMSMAPTFGERDVQLAWPRLSHHIRRARKAEARWRKHVRLNHGPGIEDVIPA